MKTGHLIFLGTLCLFLAGCSEMEMRGLGPAGKVMPAERHNQHPETPVLPRGPLQRLRRRAERGRSVRPRENASCLAAGQGGLCCGFPAWLEEAQRFYGLYAGHSPRQVDNAALPRLFDDPHFNEYGENIALVQMWDHIDPALLPHGKRKFRTYDARAPWSGIFAHWCLTGLAKDKAGAVFDSVAGDPSSIENWLKYGETSDPCLGALMVVAKENCRQIAFCVGTTLWADTAKGEEMIYLGLGGDQRNGVGVSAFRAADIQAFRLPAGYRPCREHFKLEHSPWVAQYLRDREQADLLAAV